MQLIIWTFYFENRVDLQTEGHLIFRLGSTLIPVLLLVIVSYSQRIVMSELLNPRLAKKALEGLGWSLEGFCENVTNNGYSYRRPDGVVRRIQFRGRNEQKKSNLPFWFGIYCADLYRVDDMIFWAKGEAIMLSVPTKFLLEVFDRKKAKIDEYSRWHVNIDFGHGIRPCFQPVGYSRWFKLAEYRLDFNRRIPGKPS